MSNPEILQQLQTSREYLYELFDQEERKELKLALRLLNQEIRRLDGEDTNATSGEQILESMEDLLAPLANTGSQAVVEEPLAKSGTPESLPKVLEEDSEPVSPEELVLEKSVAEPKHQAGSTTEERAGIVVEEKPSLEEWNQIVKQREEKARIEREQQRQEEEQKQLQKTIQERIKALKTDMVQIEDQRLKLIDAKEAEGANFVKQQQKIQIRKASFGRRREQTLKDEQSIREERARRKKEVLDDEKALKETQEAIARLQRELEAAQRRIENITTRLGKHEERGRNEEQAVREVQGRREELFEGEKNCDAEIDKLRKRKEGLEADYAERKLKLEDDFLGKHWQRPPLSKEHLDESLKACARLLDVPQKAMKERLSKLGLVESLKIEKSRSSLSDGGDTAGGPLQNFLKVVKR